ncbi:cationic amino acid:proton symporter, ABT family [Archaeoglobus sulfaticallidus PM70-1]|uniref:Cationic amino acid:proton symporter, ABT family n=1 Tax=Archaeoglobus sulfaticallidus PM70-1 TaxID=387631 RepID=N0BFL0_9EURY|nr:amino acid permease [Archaeoglobus sulfaticallidus]AGK61037.1 cationic amino acid:proton symporter, ABT family [Archaeoglobus sulfaticallidus PM70-1]
MMSQKIEVKLNKDLGFFDITMIGIAGMIGAGVFALTGIAAGISGPALIIAFFFNGLIATITALAYAELGSSMPQAGGGYVWIKESFPQSAGFIAGWIDWFAHSVACALYAVTFGAFVAVILEGYMPFILVSKVSSFLAVTLFAYVNYIGVKESGKVGGIITLTKVVILLVFTIFGVYRTFSNPEWVLRFTPFMPNGMQGVLAAMGLTYIAFEGYEIIVQSGEEVKNPEKNIPRAVLVSLWVATLIYILVAVSVLGGIDSDRPSWMYLGELGELGLIKTAGSIMPFGFAILLFAGLVSTTSAMNATIYSSSRVAFAMARDSFLPRALSEIDVRRRTPRNSIFFSYIIISAMTLSLPIEAVAASANIMFILLFVMVNLTLILMRYKAPNLNRPFKVPFVPYLPIVAVILQFVIGYFMISMLEHGFLALAVSVLWIVLGIVIYSSYSKEKVKEAIKEEIKTVFEEGHLEERPYRILVAYANPAIGKMLLEFSDFIAKAKNGEIKVMNVVKLPEQTPLKAGMKLVREQIEEIDELLRIPSSPAKGVIKVAHSVSDAIISEAAEYKANLVVLGWRGRTFRRDFVFGSTIDPVLLKAPCDVIVTRPEPGFNIKKVERVLIPTAGGPHVRFALQLVKDLMQISKFDVSLCFVGKNESELRKGKAVIEACRKESGIDADEILKLSDDPIKGIAEIARNYDMMFVGASDEPFFKNFIKGMFVEKLVKETNKTVVMVRKKIKVYDIIRRLF